MQLANGSLGERSHTPVMVKETMELLNPVPGSVVVDCTVGGGGHTREILQRIMPGGTLIGIDRDEAVLAATRKSLLADPRWGQCDGGDGERGNILFYHADYKDLDEALVRAGKGRVDGVLLDLGVSSIQLETSERGFSFAKDGPLDMRMDRSKGVTAFDVLNKISLKELEHILRKFGEERWARRIAKAILQQRRNVGCINTTFGLADIVKKAVPPTRKRIHPATLTFQALRSVVNRGLERVEELLSGVQRHINSCGRVVVLGFHYLEDRIVKNIFRNESRDNED